MTTPTTSNISNEPRLGQILTHLVNLNTSEPIKEQHIYGLGAAEQALAAYIQQECKAAMLRQRAFDDRTMKKKIAKTDLEARIDESKRYVDIDWTYADLRVLELEDKLKDLNQGGEDE